MSPAALQAIHDPAQLPWRSLLAVPSVLIAVSLPLVLGIVPLNRWYGYRTPRSMSSEAEWRRLNRIAGLAVIAVALVSPPVKAVLLLFVFEPSGQSLVHLVDPLILLLAVAILVAFPER
jgi:uncharacterized membrane protein